MTAAVEVRLLGAVEIRAGGEPLDVGPPQRRTVLAALAADAGRTVNVDLLVDRVWGSSPPDQARRSLHTQVSRIRRTLREAARLAAAPVAPTVVPTVVHRGEGYLLAIDPDVVDLHRFRRLVSVARAAPPAGRAAMLHAGVRCWRGSALSDLTGEWVTTVRDAWELERVDATVAWARAELDAGRGDIVIAPLRELLTQAPLAEHGAAVLIRALASEGRTGEALEHYAATRRVLIDRLGTEPGKHLRQLHQEVLRGSDDHRPPAAPRPAPVPAPTAPPEAEPAASQPHPYATPPAGRGSPP
jgi:DNA-binding SARP family transcriptional activator